MRRIERIRIWDGMRSYDSNSLSLIPYPLSPLSLVSSARDFQVVLHTLPLFIHTVLLTSAMAIRFLSSRIGGALFTCLFVRIPLIGVAIKFLEPKSRKLTRTTEGKNAGLWQGTLMSAEQSIIL